MLKNLMRGLVVLGLAGGAVSMSASDAWAQKKGKKSGKSGSSYKAPYGMAGCGLGSVIIKNDTVPSQITAGTLNGTGFQTSAISSTQSSNCQLTKDDLARAEQEVFLQANLRGLEVDVSSGGGDYTLAFAQVLGCEEDDNYGEFLEVSRVNYGSIFSSADPKVVYQRYLQVLRSSAKLADSCHRIVKA